MGSGRTRCGAFVLVPEALGRGRRRPGNRGLMASQLPNPGKKPVNLVKRLNTLRAKPPPRSTGGYSC